MSKTKQSTLTMTTRYPDGTESESKQIVVRTYPDEVPLASVTVGGSITKNLGNYESLRINASLTLPCAVEETEAAYKEAWSRVESQLTTKVNEVARG